MDREQAFLSLDYDMILNMMDLSCLIAWAFVLVLLLSRGSSAAASPFPAMGSAMPTAVGRTAGSPSPVPGPPPIVMVGLVSPVLWSVHGMDLVHPAHSRHHQQHIWDPSGCQSPSVFSIAQSNKKILNQYEFEKCFWLQFCCKSSSRLISLWLSASPHPREDSLPTKN